MVRRQRDAILAASCHSLTHRQTHFYQTLSVKLVRRGMSSITARPWVRGDLCSAAESTAAAAAAACWRTQRVNTIRVALMSEIRRSNTMGGFIARPLPLA